MKRISTGASSAGQAIRRLLRTPHAALLAARTRRLWGRQESKYQNDFNIGSTAPPFAYRAFIAHFHPYRLGPYTVQIRKGAHEALVMVAATQWIRRKIGKATKLHPPRWLENLRLPIPSNPFRMKFALTADIERELPLPLDRSQSDAVCAIMGWQGPSDTKYTNASEKAADFNRLLGEPWPNRLLRDTIRYAKQRGHRAVALLRPEYNPALSRKNLISRGDNPDDLPKIQSQFYAAARKCGMKKFPNSKYLWIFFQE